jgi:hypothetical protein
VKVWAQAIVLSALIGAPFALYGDTVILWVFGR